MATVTIDEKEYDLAALSDEAKAQIASINFVDSEMQRLHAQMAVLQTARLAYAHELNRALGVTLNL